MQLSSRFLMPRLLARSEPRDAAAQEWKQQSDRQQRGVPSRPIFSAVSLMAKHWQQETN